MANGLLLPDIAGSFNQGYDRGQQQQVNRLLGQAVANPTDSASAIGQAAAIDPKSALAVQGTIQTDQDRQQKKLAGAANYVLQAYQSGNPQQVEGAYQAVRPFLNKLGSQLGQGEASPNFTPDMLPHLYQIVGQAGGDTALNGQLPSGYRELDLQAKAAGYTPGTPEYQNAMRVGLGTVGRASNAGIGFQKVTGADGRERIVRNNPRTGAVEVYDETTGDFSPVGSGGVSAAPQLVGSVQYQPAGGAPATAAASSPAEEANALVAQGVPPDKAAMRVSAKHQQQLGGQYPTLVFQNGKFADGSTGGVPDRAPANPALMVGRAPEETARATQDAKNASDLAVLPQTETIKTNAAVEQAGRSATATNQAKNAAEQAQQNQQKSQDARQVIGLLDEADQLLPRATGSGAGRAIDSAAATFGKSTEGAQATAQLQAIAGRLTSSVPRMQGPQSNSDVRLYQQMAGDLANPSLPVATRQAASATIRKLQQKYLDNPMGNNTIVTAPGASASPGAAGNFGHLWN